MISHDITINLPEPLYQQLKQQAAQAQRSVEAELVEIVIHMIPVAGRLTPALNVLINQLPQLDEKALWRVARSSLSKKDLARLQSLNDKRQNEDLGLDEARQANLLLGQYERTILLRAKAIALLEKRGQDITEFIPD